MSARCVPREAAEAVGGAYSPEMLDPVRAAVMHSTLNAVESLLRVLWLAMPALSDEPIEADDAAALRFVIGLALEEVETGRRSAAQ